MRQLVSGSFAKQLVLSIACAALCIAGCASGGRPLGADPETWANSISIGDHLSVLTHSGQEKDVYVTAVDESGITSDKEFIPFSDIQSIRVLPKKSGGSDSTVLLIILTVAIVAALVSLVESEVEKGFVHYAQ